MRGASEHSRALLMSLPILALLALPLLALFVSSSPTELSAAVSHPLFVEALSLSARTTAVSLAVVVLLGTPLAWWLAVGPRRWTRVGAIVVDLPIVVPPAVVGIALLLAFGRRGLFGAQLDAWGVQIPFTAVAVVMAQVIVSAPFYIQSASSAFEAIDRDHLIVARTLGHSRTSTFFRVAVPMALPGLAAGIALAWARALGEFGATLIFAGNLPGRTQTMPLAIYTALESDVRIAVALSLVLAGVGVALMLPLRSAASLWGGPGRRSQWRRGAGR